jgi:hypothetical protein
MAEKYRFLLSRNWDPARASVTFIMLNPSTADEVGDDPTIRRCCGLARAWGFGGLEVVNLFALRATRPRELLAAGDPVGDGNDRAIIEAVGRASLTVAAWGNHGGHRDRAAQVLGLLAGRAVHTLGLTRQGQPRHPLYAPAGVEPSLWSGAS